MDIIIAAVLIFAGLTLAYYIGSYDYKKLFQAKWLDEGDAGYRFSPSARAKRESHTDAEGGQIEAVLIGTAIVVVDVGVNGSSADHTSSSASDYGGGFL